MSESFLSRWSRRKRESTAPDLRGESLPSGEDPRVDARSAAGEGGPTQAELVKAPPTPDPSPPRASRAGGGEPHGPAPRAAEFDPASLPAIESIDAGTDVSAFLRPGVPADLTQAALRRAWVADPAIRDFVGLAENAWDFNKPGGVPGFGPLRAIDDVQRLAAQVASVLPTAAPQTTAAEDAEASERSAQAAPASLPQDVTAPSESADAAMQNDPSSEERGPVRPRHGGALAE